MPRHRDPQAPKVVHRTARITLRPTTGQRRRLFGLLTSAGDVWACVLEANWWRRYRHAPPLAGYQELCRELATAGPSTFGELDSAGARSVLRRFSDAWFAAAKRRKAGEGTARFPRRRRRLVPIRWHRDRFTIQDGRVRLPTAAGARPLWVRLGRDLPYPVEQIRSVTLLVDGGRLCLEVTAEVPVATYLSGQAPDPGRVAGWTLASSTPTPSPDRTVRVCWCRGGRCAPSTTCTCVTPKAAAGRSPHGHPGVGRSGPGGGARPAAGNAGPRAGTGAGCGRPNTRPPRRWSAGRCSGRSAPSCWATRVGCLRSPQGGGTTGGSARGHRPG